MADNSLTVVHLIAPLFLSYRNTKELAEKSKQALAESVMFKDPIVTEIRPAAPFYEAEEYHQHFYKRTQRNMLLSKKNLAAKTL